MNKKIKFKTNCPVWQCGGTLKMVERKLPLKIKIKKWFFNQGLIDYFDESYIGDFQMLDLQCNNCGVIYSFKKWGGFRKK